MNVRDVPVGVDMGGTIDEGKCEFCRQVERGNRCRACARALQQTKCFAANRHPPDPQRCVRTYFLRDRT